MLTAPATLLGKDFVAPINGEILPPMLQEMQNAPSAPNTVQQALAYGYVMASAGERGRTSTTPSGTYSGKASMGIVDLKAALRYLHYNKAQIPDNIDRIISNGTSAGGRYRHS